MFGGLRKKLNDVWSGADFWDEKENRAQRVQAARPAQAVKAPPIQTVSRQNAPQAPASIRRISQPQPQQRTTNQLIDKSYGDGVTGMFNKYVRDTFDANTEADKIRRQAQTGLSETINQEQARRTRNAQNTNAKYSGWQQAVKSTAGEVGNFVAKTPGSLMQLQGRVGKATNTIDNPLLRTGAKLVVAPNTLLQGDKEANRQIKAGQNMNRTVENKIQQSSFGDRKDDNSTITNVGKMGGQLAGQIVTGPAGLVASGSQFAADESNKAEAAGKSNEYALGTGLVQGGLSALSEKYGVDKFIPGKSNVTGNFVTRAGKRFLTEGGQELQQQITSNLVAKAAYDPNRNPLEGAKDSFLYGGLAGGVMSPISDISGRAQKPKPTTNLVSKPAPTPQPNLNRNEAYTLSDQQEVNLGRIKDPRTVNAVSRDARNIAKRNGIDITSGSPREINDRINAVLEQPQNNRRFFKPLNEGGYILLGSPEPKKLPQDIKDQFTKQGRFGRDAIDRLEANKISKGDLERAGVLFDPKQVKKIAQTLPEFKDNPVMTYRKGDYSYTDAGYGRYPVPQKARAGVLEFKHKDGVMRLNPEALFGKEMAQKLAQTAKDGEQVDFTDTMKASGNRLFTYDQTADIPTPTVAKPVQKQVTEKQNSVDPLESLKQEARTVYRGGEPLDINKIDSSGIPLTTSEKVADYYKGGKRNGVKESYTLSPDAKIKTVKNAKTEGDRFKALAQAEKEGYDGVDFGGAESEIRLTNNSKLQAIKKQTGVHDSLADNLPNQSDRKQADNVFGLTQQSPVSDKIITQKATQSQPPKSTAKAAESKTPLEVEQELDKFYGRGGDQEFLSSVIKKYESKKDGKKSIAEMMNPEERARYDQIFSGSSSEQPAQRTNESNKGVVLSEATLADGTKQQKVLGAPGEGKVKTSSPLSDQAYKEVFGSDINVDSEPRFDAVAAGSKSNSTKRLMEAISQDEMLTQAAAQAQQDGKEINFFAKKDRNGRSVGIERFDPRYHKIEAGFVTDKNGNVLGNHIKVDETGMQVNVGGDVVNMDTVLGNPQDWEGHYEMSSTMERNIYENAPTKEIADKTYKFVVANKIKNEAVLKTELHDQRQALNQRTKETLAAKPRNVKAKEYKADVFDFVEGKMNQSELVSKYGSDTAQKVNEYKVATRKMYDNLLDRANQVFEQFGEPTVMRRKDYITHINELMSKPSFAGELYGQLQNSFLGEGQTQTRGEIPGNIAGRTENFEPRKKWNRFFQQRKGGEFTKDPFKAVDAYLEPTLYNIHMTEPAVRARAVESAFRTAREIKETDTSHVTEAFDKALDKYKTGNGGGDLVAGFQEYANAVAGKTQRWDRQVVDAGAKSRLALHGWQKLQAIGGRSTVLGNVSSVLAQPLNQVGAVAEAGPINYAKGIAASIGSDKTIEQSPFITARRTDIKSMFRSRGEKIMDVGGVPLQAVEMASVEQAWNAIHQKVKSEGLTGKEAILETDRRTERTVAGRGIADKPELYRSTIANGVLQYTLEVNASNKQFWRDLSPKQKATFLVASTGTNMLMGAVTGFEPLPDFLGAMIDTAKDFFDKDKEGNIAQKSLRGVQRGFGEYVSQNPIASAGANMLPQDTRKSIFGKDAQVSRFEGTAAPVQVVKNVVNAGSSLAKGQLTNARDSALKVAPFGNQAKKTITGTEMLARGYAVNAKGEKTFDAPTSPVGKGKALLFGPNSSGEARQYYDKKNGVTKSSTPSKTSGDLGEYGDVKNVLKAQFDTKEGREFLAMNAAEKKEAAKNDTGIRQMYEQYNTTKRVNKASPDRPAGLAKNYETFLNGHAKRTPEQRERLAYSQNDYDLKLAEAKYEEDKLKGKVSRAEKINRDYTIKKAQVGAKFSKDVRESYNSLSKAELTALAESDPNGQKIWDDAVAYGDALVEAGLLKKNKLKTKSKGGGKGRRKGKGRGGKGGRGGKRASKYDYTKDLFGSGGNIDSNNNTKALRAILAKAMSGKS